MTRPTPDRLARIRGWIAEASGIEHASLHSSIGADLLAELDAVTAERDRARDLAAAYEAELALWANGPARVRDREGRLWNRTPVDVTTIWRSMDPGMSHRQCSSLDSLARKYGPLTALPEDGHDG